MAILPDEEQYTGQPWIAQCTKAPVGDNVQIQWLKGAYTRPWSPDRRYNPCDISTDSIISKVEFTPTFRLTKSSVSLLKEALQHLEHLALDLS